jgi:hypothetical protein
MVIVIFSGFGKAALLALLIFAGHEIYAPAQVIKGRVVDSESGGAVSFASVYFSGTTVGTVAGEDGKFELDISRYASMPLTISAVGFSSATLEGFSQDKHLEVFLAPLAYDIATVNISTRSLQRERRSNLKIFREQFLGKTVYARRCAILNEEDITFNYGSDSDTLKAFTLKPLVVRNDALGYIITFYLENFKYCRATGNSLYTGTFTFTEDESSGSLEEGRRNVVYLGSAVHFFRSLWADDLNIQGFSIQDLQGNLLNYEDIVIIDEGHKYLVYQEGFRIYYDGYGIGTRSFLRPLKNRVSFDESGYFDPVAIMLMGEMGKQRVGDLLPLGFVQR